MAAQRNEFKNRQRAGPYSTNTWRDKKQKQPQHPHNSQGEEDRFPVPRVPPSNNSSQMKDHFEEAPPAAAVVGKGGEGEVDGFLRNVQENVRREKKFANRARVYVGNLPRGITESELMSLFKPYGEITQVYLEKDKNFGFARMAYKDQAVRAIAALNGSEVKGREIKVRFAASSCSVKVSNLHPMVSNELLHNAFSVFGEVEYAVVVTDDRGRSVGHGFVDFAKKTHAALAIERCTHSCFFLTKSPIPVSVTELIRENDEDGLPDKELCKSNGFDYERETPPRMALHGTPEFDFGMRFKALYDEEKKLREELDARLKDTRDQLEGEMEQFKHHEHANVLRLQLAEYQKEQAILQQRLHRHEQFLKGPGPLPPPPPPMPGHPPPHMPPPHLLPPPGMGQPPLMGPPPPQPLLAMENDRGMGVGSGGPPHPLMGGPPQRPTMPPFLLPSPGQHMPPPS